MAFSSQPLRRKSSTGFNAVPEHDDGGLTQSLSNLSLDPHDRQDYSPRAKPPTPLKPPRSRHSSPSPNRPLSRSTSRGRDSDGGVSANAGGQTLLRKASTNSLRSANGVTPGRVPSRRSSYGAGLAPSSPSATSTFPVAIEKPPVTAASVAHDYFTAEYEGLHDSEARPKTNAIVILNDAVYGHRFSRPRTSRSALATIVERPERVRAAVLGLSMAYVRLGERHSEGSMPVHPKADIHSIDRLPFRIQKTTRRMPLNSPAVTNVHGLKWMEELTMMCTSAEAKLAMGGKELQRPELDRGSTGPPAKLHEGDLYLCSESLNAMEGAMGAVCEAVDVVFTTGPRTAFVGIRPPGHHCSSSYPSGFCWVNNVHVGIMHGILNHGLTHAAIIDFDLHHGDGSQAITWQHNTRSVGARKNDAPWKKTSIGYFSLHDINSYPCEGGDEDKVKNASLCIDNAHGQTIWNVHLQSWKTEQDFWKLYEGQYNVILEKTRSYLKTQSEKVRATGQTPKAAIFFSAGFDASEWESAGMQRHQVNVPTEFYARLGEDVVSMAAEEGLSVDGRVISVLEGGYSDRALASGVLSHMSGLAAKRASRVSKTQVNVDDMATHGEPQDLVYDPAWWSSAELDRLENHMTNPPTPPKKPRYNIPPTYSSPTQASTAKVAEPIKIRRSFSGMSQNNGAMPIRSISPPPPEVPWPVAAHELSKVLIPSERQTESCKPEDLNAEATKARRDRQSQLLGNAWPAPPVPEQPTRMALRGRKPKPIGAIDEEGADSRPQSRAETDSAPVSPRKRNATPSRAGATTPARKTQAAPRATPSRTPRAQPNTSRRTSRRLSASALLSPTKEGPEQGIPDVPAIPSTAFEEHRPSSAVSAQTPTAGKLAIKKTRPATTGKPAPVRAARGGKKSTVAGSSRAASSGTNTGEQSRDELDNITTGMKKIKINLITQAQREAKEKAKREASSGFSTPVEENAPSNFGGSRSLMSPTMEDSLTLPPPPENLVGASPMPFVPSGISVPMGAQLSSSEVSTPTVEQGSMSPTPGSIPMPASSPPLPDEAGSASGGMDMFIPYQPEGPSPVAVSQTEPLKWLPPNAGASTAGTPVGTPSPVKRHHNLFNQATGISFAPRGENKNGPRSEGLSIGAGEEKREEKDGVPMSSIPETPK